MDEHNKALKIFLVLILIYLFASTLGGFISQTFGLLMKLILVGGYLWYFRSWFSFKLKFDWLALVSGIAIVALWVGLDPYYSHLPITETLTFSTVDIVLKLIIGVFLASVVEEYFTRYFLHRAVAVKDWLPAPLGVYSLKPFMVTTLFFALAHHRWLAGLLTGVILNLVWYKRKDMNSIVSTHAIANFLLGIYVLFTGNFAFWS